MTNNHQNQPQVLGSHYDLAQIFNDLNTRFFEKKISASITWGRRRKARSKKSSIRLGSYHHDTRAIIINPCLDQAQVPAICVERIVFHEMNHQKYPIKRVKGKNLIHYREFYEYEKTYPYLKEADSWIKANLGLLLSY